MFSESNSFKDYDDGFNYWIHKIDFKDISKLNSTKCLGSKNKNSLNFRKIKENDKIILATKRKCLEFFAFTVVDKIIRDKNEFDDNEFSPKKLKLKGIKYFSTPVDIVDIKEELTFIRYKHKYASYFLSEYRQISEEDFMTILGEKSFSKEFPSYFEEIDMDLKEFILCTIKSLFKIINLYEDRNQIEIKRFLSILKDVLMEYGINKSLNELEIFYGMNAYKLRFKHVPSRDSSNFVTLYTESGDEKDFGYISLE